MNCNHDSARDIFNKTSYLREEYSQTVVSLKNVDPTSAAYLPDQDSVMSHMKSWGGWLGYIGTYLGMDETYFL